jgi:hypothetical protein
MGGLGSITPALHLPVLPVLQVGFVQIEHGEGISSLIDSKCSDEASNDCWERNWCHPPRILLIKHIVHWSIRAYLLGKQAHTTRCRFLVSPLQSRG